MQRNIDTFFKRVNKPEKSENPSLAPQKRKKVIESSDEDEIIKASPKPSKKTRPNDEKKSPRSSKKPKLSNLRTSPRKELKKVDPNSLFGGEPMRVEAPKPPKPKEAALIELEDDEIDKSLLDVDANLLESHLQAKEHISPKEEKKNTPEVKNEKISGHNHKATPSKRNGNHLEVDGEQEKRKRKEKETPPQQKHSASEKKEKSHTPKAKKEKHDDLDSSVLTDEERHERKRMAAVLYQKFKNRSSCLNPGSKEVPKGKPNCLAGLSFLVTGVLESLERDEANSIIKEYGGKLMSTVGKRLNYLIVGEDAGPKKLAQADENGVTILSEDGLFDLIRERSGNAQTKENADNIKSKEKATTSVANKVSPKEVKIKSEKITPEKSVKKNLNAVTIKKEPNNNGSVNVVDTKVKEESKESLTELKPPISEDAMTWVDKYKPSNIKEIIGQQGAASNVVKLTNWLSKWYANHDGKKKLQKPNPWAKNDDGSYYKAALLSGPPGIGKTTTATLVCKELGFDTVEFNASDTRSKRLLKEEVSELLSNKSLYGYCHGNPQAVSKKHVLIMDEVDGMAGNEDRGGIQELIGLIKDSSVPIICMCNDRNHQKMRSLVNYCFDLRFQRPRLEQIKGRLLTILHREKFKVEPAKLEEIISATNNDIRQSINHISLLSANKELDLKPREGKIEEKVAGKDLKLGPWDVVRKVFSADDHKHMSVYDKCDLFFHDYSLAPLFVQQNYLQVSPHGPKNEVLKKIAKTADALSLGDLVDKRIRSRSAWTLLPVQAVFSSFMPGEFMCGHFTGQINFPGWLGKNSRANKRSRLAQEIHDHTRVRTSGSRLSVRLDYAQFILDSIVRPLKEHGMEGVEQALNVMKEYHLLREDIDSLLELTSWPGKKQAFDGVDGRVKAALTRAYNKEVLAYSYSVNAGVKKKRAEIDEMDILNEGEEGETLAVDSDEEKNDDFENDGLIKAKKKSSATTSKGSSGASKAKGASASKSATEKSNKSKASTSKSKK